MMRRLVHLLRKTVGTEGTVDAIVTHTNHQTDDLIQHGNHVLADLTGYVDARIASLQDNLARHLYDAVQPADRTAVPSPGGARAAVPADVQMLDQLSRWARSVEELDLRSLGELESLSRKGLFVVGNARSGTTILQRCLNLSREVYLLDESNVYVNHSKPQFTSWFEEQREQSRKPIEKGTFIPEPPVPLCGGLAYLAWLARHYRYVGEKVAFGPHGTLDGVAYQDAFLQFQCRFFFSATYFNIVRAPAECVWSLHKKFPDATIESLIESWLRSALLCNDLVGAFPNCYTLFFENLDGGAIARLADILQVELVLPPEMLSDRRQQSRLQPGELPEELSAFAKPLEACQGAYERLKSAFSPHTLRFEDTEGGVRPFLQSFRIEIKRMLDLLRPGAASLPPKSAGRRLVGRASEPSSLVFGRGATAQDRLSPNTCSSPPFATSANGMTILEGTPYSRFLLPVDYLPSRDFRPRWGGSRPRHAGLLDLLNRDKADYPLILSEIRRLEPVFSEVKRKYDGEAATEPGWVGGAINPLDLVVLYYFIARYKPTTYLEIGSGLSTCFARKAISDQKLATRIVSIDPQPRAKIDTICDEVVRDALETVDLGIFESLAPGDIVFMDGSHRSFMNSDVTVFMLDVLPLLKPGVIVHVHDVFLPNDYPEVFRNWYWSEQYLLAVYLLAAQDRVKILMPVSHVQTDPDLRKCLTPPIVDLGEDSAGFLAGGSFWFTHTSGEVST